MWRNNRARNLTALLLGVLVFTKPILPSAFAEGGGVGNGGNIIKLEFYRVASQIAYYLQLPTDAGGHTRGEYFFGSEFTQEKLQLALADQNIFVYTDSVPAVRGANTKTSAVHPIGLEENEWMKRIVADDALELPICLEIAKSIGILDQPKQRCEAIVSRFFSAKGRWSYGLLPSELTGQRIQALFAENSKLPGGCTFQAAGPGTAGRQGYLLSKGESSVHIYLDHLLSHATKEFREAGVRLRRVSIFSDDPEGNYSRHLALFIVTRKSDLKVIRIQARESVQKTWSSRKITHSVRCENESASSAVETNSLIRDYFTAVSTEIIPKIQDENTSLSLRRAAASENLEVVRSPMTDRYGSVVHAKVDLKPGFGNIRKIFLSQPVWSYFLIHHRPLSLMVCHELMRSIGVDDNEFKVCFARLGSFEAFDLLSVDLMRLEYFLDSKKVLPGGCQVLNPNTTLVQGEKRIGIDSRHFQFASTKEEEWSSSWFRHSAHGRSEFQGIKKAAFEFESLASSLKIRIQVVYRTEWFEPGGALWPYSVSRPDSDEITELQVTDAFGKVIMDCR